MCSFRSENQACSSLGFGRQGEAAHSILSLHVHWHLLEEVVDGGMVQVELVEERQDLGVSVLLGSHKQKFRGLPPDPSFHRAEIIEQLSRSGHHNPSL